MILPDVAATASLAGIRIVTLASAARREHLDVQLSALRPARARGAARTVVWLDDDVPDDLEAETVLSVPPGKQGLRLAAARNAGADRAAADGAWLVVFLDADCVPDPGLVDRYAAAARDRPEAVLCGPVTYLAAGVDASDSATLHRHRDPHPARPDPAAGSLVDAAADEYALFWSLSFAITTSRWRRGPRFDERYEGYGGEDTDFAFALRQSEVPLVWVGGADAFHQHHATSSPPVQHLDDILRNGSIFAERWGEWPMTGWLTAFEERGLVSRTADGGWRAP